MENTKQKYILDGEIPLGTSVNYIRDYSHYLWNYGLPENLQYRKDLLRVTMEQETSSRPASSKIHEECINTFFTVEILENTFQALNEYAFVMAHLEIATSEVDIYNSIHTGSNKGIYRLTSVGKLSTELAEHLRQFRPAKPKDINKPFTVLGMEVLFNEDPETRENHAFKLTNGYLLPTYQDASALEIACSLMEYMTWLYRKTLCKVYQEEK